MLPQGPRNLVHSYFNLTGNDRLDWFQSLYSEYGDTVGIKIANQQIVVTRDPAIAEEVLQNPLKFRKTALGYRVIDKIGKDGLFTSDYEKWRKRRPILQPFFTKIHQRLYVDQMQRVIEQKIESLSQPGHSQPLDLKHLMGEITMDISLSIFFGYKADDSTVNELLDFGNELSRVSAFRLKHPLLSPSFPLPINIGFNRQVKRVKELCKHIIDDRQCRDINESDDFLGTLLLLHRLDKEEMTEEMIIHEMITFIIAGALTTAHALSWMWYELFRNPEVYKALVANMDKELGSAPVSQQYIDACDLLQNVVKETARLHPSIPVIPRGVRNPNTALGPYLLPRYTEVLVDLYGLNRHPENFYAPNTFDPTRFSGSNFRPFEYMPWGGGVRKCIGSSLSVLETGLVISTCLRKLQFKPDLTSNPKRMFDVTLYPEKLMVEVLPRLQTV